MRTDTTDTILAFARRLFAGTLLSRVSGGVRDVVMAITFGSSPEIGAFMVAYRLTHLMRRLIGEGNLQAGFVPHFESLHKQDPKQALAFFRDSVYSLTIVLLALVFLLEVLLYALTLILSPDWREIVELSMWMAPGLLFICLYAINGAFLQCRKSYFSFAAAPLFFNACWVASALAFHSLPLAQAVRFLAIGTTVACAAQWAFTVFRAASHCPVSSWRRLNLFSHDWKQLMHPILLGIVGVGSSQINSALDAIFSRFADLAGPAYLWYAIRFQQLPLALFGIALSGAALAPLSRAAHAEDWGHYRDLLQRVLRHSIVLLIPCTFAFFALGGPILNVFYGHGDFDSHAVHETLYCLWGYCLGLVPAALVLVLATGFYAHKSYTTPALASVASVLLNVILNVAMVFLLHWGAFSIAIGTSIAVLLNFAILWRALSGRLGGCVLNGMRGLFTKLTAASSLATFATLGVGCLFFNDPSVLGGSFPRNFQAQIFQLVGMGMTFFITIAAAVYALRIREILDIFRKSPQAEGS